MFAHSLNVLSPSGFKAAGLAKRDFKLLRAQQSSFVPLLYLSLALRIVLLIFNYSHQSQTFQICTRKQTKVRNMYAIHAK